VFNDNFIASFILSLWVKEYQSTFGGVTDNLSPVFFDLVYIYMYTSRQHACLQGTNLGYFYVFVVRLV